MGTWRVLHWQGAGSWMDSLGSFSLCENRGVRRALSGHAWVRIKEQTLWAKSHWVSAVGCLPRADIFHRQLGIASHSQALVFMGSFNHTIIGWRDSTVWHKQFRRSSFPDPSSGETNEERDSTGIHKRKDSLGYVKAEVTMRQWTGRRITTVLEFRTVDFSCFKDLLEWVTFKGEALEGGRARKAG